MPQIVTLTTFFRAADDESMDPLGPAAYVAGLESQEGKPCGMAISLEPEDVEPVVLADARFSILLRPDGTLLIEADGLSDAAIEQISGRYLTAHAAIDDLVREALRPELLAMEDDPQTELRKLRNRLKDTLGLVEEALRKLG